MVAPTEFARLHAKVKLHLLRRDTDPLAYWHHAAPQSKTASKLLKFFREVYVRAANLSGKTEWAAAIVLAMLKKQRSLDGVALPQWRGKVDALCLVRDYRQLKLSVQQTLLRLLGKWPHKARYVGDTLVSLKVKPLGGSDDERDWSSLTILSQENRRAGLGARADIVWADEPPVEPIWREVRKAGHAGRRRVRIISATPTIRSQWAWLEKDYSPEAKRGRTQKHQDWAEVRWSLDDVPEHILPKSHKDELRRDYSKEGKKMSEAREFGDYVDTSGDCPFDVDTLYEMLTECRDPEAREWRISREIDGADGRVIKLEKVTVEVFSDAIAGRQYHLGVDPSKGIASDRHDPGGILVTEQGSGDVVALYNGYIGSYGLGCLAAGLARQYNDAIVDPENNSGWFEGVMRGLSASGYGRIARTKVAGSPGGDKYEVRWGFTTTAQTRNAMIAAVQDWIQAWKAGERWGRCPSRVVIQQLLDTILDEDGKPVAAPGLHDEFLILRGQSLRKTRMVRHDPNIARMIESVPKRKTGALKEITTSDLLSESVEREPWGGRMHIPKPLQRPA